MKHLRKFNESYIEDYTALPEEAIKELEMYVDVNNPNNKIEVVEDPNVYGTYAVQIYRESDDYTFHLLWHHGGFDEVDFDTFPPKTGDLQFFI